MSESKGFSPVVAELEKLVMSRYEGSLLVAYVALWGKALAHLTEEQLTMLLEGEKTIQEVTKK